MGLGLEGALPELGRLGLPPEVEERHRAVVEGVGGTLAHPRLPAQVGPFRGRLVGLTQRGRRVEEAPRALLRVLAEAAPEEVGHGSRHFGQAGGGREQVFLEGIGAGHPPLPRALAGEHLEDRQGPAPEVGSAGQGVPARLLGGHVGRGAAARTLDAQGLPAPGGTRGRGHRQVPQAARAREAEVRDLGHPVARDHDVGRLHVEVDEPLLVGVVKPPGELDGHVQHLVEGGELPGPDPVVHAAAVHELREDHGQALQAAHVEAGHRVRVQAQVHPGLRLALEEVGSSLRFEEHGPRHLGREVEVPAAVTHLVDATHAALSEQAQDLVQVEKDLAHLPFGEPLGGESPARAGAGGDEGGGPPHVQARGQGLGGLVDGGLGCYRLHPEGDRAARAADVPAQEARGRVVRARATARADDADRLPRHQPTASRRASRSSAAVG